MCCLRLFLWFSTALNCGSSSFSAFLKQFQLNCFILCTLLFSETDLLIGMKIESVLMLNIKKNEVQKKNVKYLLQILRGKKTGKTF